MGDERIETRWFTAKEIDGLIRQGKVEDGKTLIGYLTWQRYHKSNAGRTSSVRAGLQSR